MKNQYYLQLLKLIIKEAVSDKPYGDYLFGDERNKPSAKSKETNTPEENKLSKALQLHYDGDPDSLNPYLSKLNNLEKQDSYKDVLSVPSEYQYAYRVMSNISLETLTTILGEEPTDYESNEIYEAEGGVFTPKSPRDHYSWSVNHKVFKNIAEDWGGIKHFRPNTFLVFLRAPIASNRFLLNPNETAPLAKDYAYQDEVISIGSIECDRVWYMFTERDKSKGFKIGPAPYADAEKKFVQHIIKQGDK